MEKRTDRHNNPIAVSNAKEIWLETLEKHGIDFSLGDRFPSGNLKTLRFPSVATGQEASRILLGLTDAFFWYKNHTGKEIIAKYKLETPDDFAKQSMVIQNEIINDIYKHETGDGRLLIKETDDLPQNEIELIREPNNGGFYFVKNGTNKVQKITASNAGLALITILTRQGMLKKRDVTDQEIKAKLVETDEFF